MVCFLKLYMILGIKMCGRETTALDEGNEKMAKLSFCFACGISISSGRNPCRSLKNRNKIIVVVKAAFSGNLSKRKPGLLRQQSPGFFEYDGHARILW